MKVEFPVCVVPATHCQQLIFTQQLTAVVFRTHSCLVFGLQHVVHHRTENFCRLHLHITQRVRTNPYVHTHACTHACRLAFGESAACVMLNYGSNVFRHDPFSVKHKLCTRQCSKDVQEMI